MSFKISILNRLMDSLLGRVGLKKEALFHCADELFREVVGRILEIDLNRQKASFLLQRAFRSVILGALE